MFLPSFLASKKSRITSPPFSLNSSPSPRYLNPTPKNSDCYPRCVPTPADSFHVLVATTNSPITLALRSPEPSMSLLCKINLDPHLPSSWKSDGLPPGFDFSLFVSPLPLSSLAETPTSFSSPHILLFSSIGGLFFTFPSRLRVKAPLFSPPQINVRALPSSAPAPLSAVILAAVIIVPNEADVSIDIKIKFETFVLPTPFSKAR